MSNTTLYVIESDGSLTEWTEYKNSHGSAPAIWSTLAAKYVPGVRQIGDRDYSKRSFMDDGVSREVWQLANGGGMEEFERRTCWTTYDRAVVRVEDVPLYADALAEFARVHGPAHEHAGHVFHVDKMADDLRAILAESDAKGWRGVAWNQTSVSDTWHSQEPTVEMRRATIEQHVREAASDQPFTIDAVVDLIMGAIEEVQDGGDLVEDNVDAFGCTWLPSANVNRLD